MSHKSSSGESVIPVARLYQGVHNVSRSIDGHCFSLHRCWRLSLTPEILVTSLLASDDDSDEGVVDITSQEVDNSASDAARGSKRARSRSKSLTPPPKLSLEQILNVRKVIE